MATIRWKRADSYEEANNYIGANGEVVVDLAENRLWVYDGANAYVTAAFTSQAGEYVAPYVWQGENAGYLGGGKKGSLGSGTSPSEVVQKFSFASDANAVDIAEFASPVLAGSQIINHDASAAYFTGGQIQKTPYASDECVQVDYSSGAPSNASEDGGEPWSSAEHGYYNERGTIHKFPFAITLPGIGSPTSWSAMPALPSSVRTNRNSSTAQSETHGYKVMGRAPSPSSQYRGTVAKYPFASNTVYEDVGELLNDPSARVYMAGASVGDKGLSMGGETSGGSIGSVCDAIAFSSDTLTAAERYLGTNRGYGAGLSSTSAFYYAGGQGSPFSFTTTEILKSPAASGVNLTSTAYLVQAHLKSSTLGAND